MGGSAVSADVIAAAVAAAKIYLRQDEQGEDALIATLAAGAIAVGEAYCATPFVTRGFEDVLGIGTDWQRLRHAPVAGIEGVTGLPAGGAPFVMAADDYRGVIDGDGIGWVRVNISGAAARVAVSYSAGLAAEWDAVPVPITQGVTMLIAHLFGDRSSDSAPPAAVAALWRPFRRMTLGQAARP
jgi:uncharacterized phiE125 gp8 family phage protein